MSSAPPPRIGPGPPPGLCAGCRHGRRLETRAGSVFWLCRRSVTDLAYPRYPALPVVRCAGFAVADPPDGTPAAR